jgi:hypothetical protein
MKLNATIAIKLSLSALTMFFCQATYADNWAFLKDTPLSKFSEEDRKMMMSNAVETVNDDSSTAARSWKNKKTSHSGTAQVLLAYAGPDNIPCKRIRIVNRAGDNQNRANYSVCKFADEGWKLVSNDFAPYQNKTEKK